MKYLISHNHLFTNILLTMNTDMIIILSKFFVSENYSYLSAPHDATIIILTAKMIKKHLFIYHCEKEVYDHSFKVEQHRQTHLCVGENDK